MRTVLLGTALAGAAFMALRPPKGRTPERFEFVDIDGLTLHFQQMGEGPVVVLLHGASGHLQDMTFQIAPDLARDHHVICFDRPGLGLSDPLPDPGDLGAQARHLAAAMEALGHDSYVVVGHSFGGAVALRWMLERPAPITGLCLISTPSHRWPTDLEFYYEYADARILGDAMLQILPRLVGPERIRQALSGIYEPNPVPDGYLDHINPDLTLRPAVFAANAKQVGALKAELTDMETQYSQISVPVELIQGNADTVVPKAVHSDKLAPMLQNMRYTEMPGVGHAPHNAKPDVILAAIRRLTAVS